MIYRQKEYFIIHPERLEPVLTVLVMDVQSIQLLMNDDGGQSQISDTPLSAEGQKVPKKMFHFLVLSMFDHSSHSFTHSFFFCLIFIPYSIPFQSFLFIIFIHHLHSSPLIITLVHRLKLGPSPLCPSIHFVVCWLRR